MEPRRERLAGDPGGKSVASTGFCARNEGEGGVLFLNAGEEGEERGNWSPFPPS